jgi:hypothetical protein
MFMMQPAENLLRDDSKTGWQPISVGTGQNCRWNEGQTFVDALEKGLGMM